MSVFDISEFQPEDRVQCLVGGSYGSCDGIILKLGETSNGYPELDPQFIQFVNEVVAARLPYGVYYVSHAQDMDDFIGEASWTNEQIYGLLNGQFPLLGLWWDMEVGAVQRGDVWPELRDIILMQRNWYTANQGKIGIYAGYSYFNEYCDFNELAVYQIPVWPAQYGWHENSLKAEHPELKHVAWQFTTHDETQDENEWYGF